MSELYKLPDGWEWKNIGETCENLDRLRKPISQKNRVFGKYPYYGATKIVDYIDDYIFDEQLILIGEDGAKWDIGDETAFLATGKYWVNNHAHVIRPNRKILDDSWLVYYLFVTDLSDYITGTTVPKLNQAKLKEISFPLPPLQEQKRIVSKLDNLFEKIDKSIVLHQKNMNEADVFMGSVLNDVFGELEEKYGLIKINDIVLKTKNKNPKDNLDKPFTYIDISSIDNKLFRIIEPKQLIGREAPSRAKKEVVLGDILYSTTRPNLKNISIVREKYDNPIASTGFCVLRVNNKALNLYLFYYLVTDKLFEQIEPNIRGAQYPATSDKDLKNCNIPNTPLNIQQKTVKYLDEISQKVEKIKSVQKEKMESLVALKASILDQAFKGEL